MKSRFTILAYSAFSSIFLIAHLSGQVPDREKVVAGAERAFEKAARTNAVPAPGCAVGVSLNGESVFEKAFGLAEMEHGIANTPRTIFESGSVAKQFTAAAVVLLALDGKLSLDDPVKKHIPELPDYGSPLTIRHLLNHTAGLRDWGTVMALTGVGRGDRVVTQDVALDVIFNQKALDFTPGAEYSYSNSGYQLAAAIVERVSKQKFGAFVTERLFKPLGMTQSSWRDDYRRLVPGRAQGYSRSGNGPWRLNMPFMDVVGNGGMLTTVGDWLKWNAMLDARFLGAPLVEALETQGLLKDGRKSTYALGLIVNPYNGLREISHGGATAGYQTFLARYPDRKLSVAVLCNGTAPSAAGLAHRVVDEVLGPFPASSPLQSIATKPEYMQKFVGLWRNEKTHAPFAVALDNGVLRLNGGALTATGDGAFQLGSIRLAFKLGPDGKVTSAEVNNVGQISRLISEPQWMPTTAELASFVGDWFSDEAGARFTVALEDDKAFLKQRSATKIALVPVYKDHFTAHGQIVWFARDKEGKVTEMHVGASRMRDMAFERVRK